jgi:uncharacterized protein YecT (DUF1311 family)
MLGAAILAATGLAATSPAMSPTGIPGESSRQLDACIKAAGAVDLQDKDCYVGLAQREDARLNGNWRRLINAVGGANTAKGKALLAEQKAWLAYRDAACLHWMIDGGTLDRLQSQICYTNLITERADEIGDFAETYEQTYSRN